MRIRQIGVAFTVVLSAMGYVGAGLFYGYLLGFNTQTYLTCPLCPTIFSIGHPLQHFAVQTLVLGYLNAILFMSVAWSLRGLTVIAGKISRRDRTER